MSPCSAFGHEPSFTFDGFRQRCFAHSHIGRERVQRSQPWPHATGYASNGNSIPDASRCESCGSSQLDRAALQARQRHLATHGGVNTERRFANRYGRGVRSGGRLMKSTYVRQRKAGQEGRLCHGARANYADLFRRTTAPTAARPASIRAYVWGSGTAATDLTVSPIS